MLVCYAFEYAAACVLGSVYGFRQGAWPFGIVEAIWAAVALHRWWQVWRTFADLREEA
jgi:hypothetical protein